MSDYDPIEIPKEIMESAIKVDQWAKLNGWEEYAIGPIRNRFGKNVHSEMAELKARIRRIEVFLNL